MKSFFQLIGLLIAIAVVLFLIGTIVSLAWNITMPFIFGLPKLGIGHGIGLFVLARILFVTRYGNKGE